MHLEIHSTLLVHINQKRQFGIHDTTQTSDNKFTIDLKRFKRCAIKFECYSNNGSGQAPYVAAYVINTSGATVRRIYYYSTTTLDYTWTVNAVVTRADIQDGLVRILLRAFGSVYSPDNPSWCVQRIKVTSLILYKE